MLDGLRDSLRSLSIGAAPRPARGEEPSVRSRPASPRGAPPPPPRAAVAGVLQHRVSLGAGWRPRLFVLGRGGVLRYYKAYGPAAADVAALLDAVRAEEGEVALVGAEVSILEARDRARASARAGAAAAALLHRTVSSAGSDQAAARPPVAASPLAPAAAAPFEPRGEVHLGVARVRLSGADARRLYIHTGTDTLTVRAEAADDRWAWAEALAGAKRAADDAAAGAAVAPGAAELAAAAADAAARLAAAGVDAETRGAVGAALSAAVAAARERDALLSRVRALEQDRRALETALAVEGGRGGDPAPRRSFDSASGGAPRPGGAATPSPRGAPPLGSDDGEGGGSAAGLGGDTSEDEEEFFDADTGSGRASRAASRSASALDLAGADLAAAARALALHAAAQPQPPPPQQLPEPAWLAAEGPPPPRRDRLPPPEEPERSISLWSLIREMVGKDLTRVCLPVYFNEPLSALQKSAEDLEYSALLDEAAALPPASPERLLRVAAFAVSAYSSTEGRTAKPFNPLLGETYELAAPERGWRFLAEKVCHHPTIVAATAEGRAWRFEGDACIRSRFWGRSIELRPEGVLKLTFSDGDAYAWSKVATSINNLILGKIYVDHGGVMRVRCLSAAARGLAARLRFKEAGGLFDRDPRQVRGFLERDGRRLEAPTIFGHWDSALHTELEDGRVVELWRKAPPPPEPTRYNLTRFAIELNELTPGLEAKLAPTDCRLRPDQAATERGRWGAANAEKQRLEAKQRAARAAAEAGAPLRPRWFEVLPAGEAAGAGGGAGGGAAAARRPRGADELAFRYRGGYWEARAAGAWDGVRDIFGRDA